jgi:hypothetical protein
VERFLRLPLVGEGAGEGSAEREVEEGRVKDRGRGIKCEGWREKHGSFIEEKERVEESEGVRVRINCEQNNVVMWVWPGFYFEVIQCLLLNYFDRRRVGLWLIHE